MKLEIRDRHSQHDSFQELLFDSSVEFCVAINGQTKTTITWKEGQSVSETSELPRSWQSKFVVKVSESGGAQEVSELINLDGLSGSRVDLSFSSDLKGPKAIEDLNIKENRVVRNITVHGEGVDVLNALCPHLHLFRGLNSLKMFSITEKLCEAIQSTKNLQNIIFISNPKIPTQDLKSLIAACKGRNLSVKYADPETLKGRNDLKFEFND